MDAKHDRSKEINPMSTATTKELIEISSAGVNRGVLDSVDEYFRGIRYRSVTGGSEENKERMWKKE